jgi:tetratricopeptide (TPR) repeat protein
MRIALMKASCLALACVLILFITACSTAPKPKEEIIEKKNKAAEYAEFGNSYYYQGLFGKAIEFFNLSLAYNGSVDNQPGIVRSYNSLGKVNLARGFLENAEGYFAKAYELAEALEDDILLAQSLSHRGELAARRENYNQALTLLQKALEHTEKGTIEGVKAVIYSNLGTVYRKLGKMDEALTYFNQARDLSAKEKNFGELATVCYKIAALYSEKGEYGKALEFVGYALENDKKVESSFGIAKDYLAMGTISMKSGNEGQAYLYFRRALLVYRSMAILNPDISVSDDVQILLAHLIDLARKLGKEEEAENYQQILSGGKE